MNKLIIKNKAQNGYMAIVTVIILFSIIVSVGLAVSLTSISEGYMTLDTKKSYSQIYGIESCLEEALLNVIELNSIPSTINLSNGMVCQITVDDLGDQNYNINISIDDKSAIVSIRLDETINIINYQLMEF